MTTIVYFVVLNVLAHLAFVGSRLATSLFALHLGASAFTIGMLMMLYALVPMLLSVSAGRTIDRMGVGRPILVSLVAMVLGVGLPFFLPYMATLYVSSTLAGTSFMYMHIAMNNVVGAIGRPEQRSVNFSWLSLGFSTSGSLGPLVAGYAIDGLGHANAFGLLALFPIAALVLLWARRAPIPRPERAAADAPHGHVFELLKIPPLRRAFIVSAVLATGWDLYAFLLPLYGAQIGLPAARIGVIMAIFAAATFVVRLAMPLIIRRLRDWQIITAALAISAASYLIFPFVKSVPLLMTLSFALGVGLGSAQPLIMAMLFNTSPPGRQGEVVGIRSFLLNASHTAIPFTSGALSALIGMGPVFWAVGVGLAAAAWVSGRRARRRVA